jgi:hypothetical protein
LLSVTALVTTIESDEVGAGVGVELLEHVHVPLDGAALIQAAALPDEYPDAYERRKVLSAFNFMVV